MNKNQLKKAVILGLLLSNTCGFIEAAEYTTTITGKESGYDSIRTVDPASGEIRYDFSGDNKIKTDSADFRPINLDDTKVTINIGDKLTLIGKDPTQQIKDGIILANSANDVLTFNGNELNIQDISTSYRSPQLVTAADGGSIVFNNKMTEIGTYDQQNGSLGLNVVGAGSSIVFTDNVDRLDVNTMRGINVENGANFEFNNTNGIVSIQSIGSSAITMRGGDLTIKGQETIISSSTSDGLRGNWGIGIESNAISSTLNFDADKVSITGRQQGIYVYNDQSDTVMNFKGTVYIKSLNNATGIAGDGAKGIESYVGTSNIKFEKHVVLDAECGRAIGTDDVAFGAQIERGSVLTALEGIEVRAKAVSGKAFGLGTYGANSLIAVTGGSKIDVSSVDGSAIGIQGWSNSTVDIKGLTKITAYSEKNNAIGIWANHSGLVSLEDLSIDSTATTAGSVTSGILSNNSGQVTVNGSALLNVKTDTTNIKGIHGDTMGKITIAKDAEINVQTGYHYARGITSQGAAAVKIEGDALVNVNSTYSSIGLDVFADNSILTINGTAAIKTTGDNDATGVSVSSKGQVVVGTDFIAEVSSKTLATGIKLDEGKTTINGTASITASSSEGAATGLSTWHTCTVDMAALKIRVDSTGTGNNSGYGINNQWDSAVNIAGDADIVVNTKEHKATGIRNYWNSTVDIGGSARIVVNNNSNNHFAYGIDATADGSNVNTALTINKDAYIEVSGKQSEGINTNNNTVTIGGNAVIKTTSKGESTHGILAKATSNINIGGDSYIDAYSETHSAEGIRLESGGNISIGKNLVIDAHSAGKDANGIFLWTDAANKTGSIDIAGSAIINTQAKEKAVGIMAFVADGTVALKALQGADIQVTSEQGTAHGIFAEKNGNVEIGGVSNVVTISSGKNAMAVMAQNTGKITLHDVNAIAISKAGGDASNTTDGITASTNSHIAISGNANVFASAQDCMANGVDAYDSVLNIDGTLAATVFSKAEAAYGVHAYNSQMAVQGDAYIDAQSINGQAIGINAENNSTMNFGKKVIVKIGNTEQPQTNRAANDNFAIVSRDDSKINFAEDVFIDISATAAGRTSHGVYAATKGQLDFQKGLVLDNQGTGYTLRATGVDSSISVNSAGGGTVHLTGSIVADNQASISINMDTNNAYFSGTTHELSNGTIGMQLSQGALWQLTADSDLSSLAFNSGATLDMATNKGMQNLKVNNLSGSNAVLSMGVNLYDGLSDKVYIANSSTGQGTHLIKVYDEKLSSGDNLHILLVDDASGKYNFEATDAYGGGLFTYKATLSSEDGTGTQWYLEKLTRGNATNDAYNLADSNDTIYADWVNNSDNLSNRLTELRDNAVEKGLWVNMHGGKLKGDKFSNNYQTYQIGYDAPFKSTNNNSDSVWVGGVALEYGKGSVGYTSGSGDHSSGAISLYASKHTANNENIHFIIKNGYLRGNLKTYDIASDTGDYKTQALSISAEYNKRFIQKDGLYIEPRIQLILGHINEHNFTSGKNNIDVRYDGMNSAIGRLGFTAGKTMQNSELYMKMSVAHEFAGNGAVTLTAGNEQIRVAKEYGGTWLELGLGGKYTINKNSSAYLEAQRSFGGSYQRQWQVKAGVQWSF